MIHSPRKYIAADVSKRTLVTHDGTKSGSSSYDPQGLQELIQRSKAIPNCIIVCESTGGYERPLLEACWDAGVEIARVNPALIRHHAKSKGIRAKTDPIDSAAILGFAQANHPTPTRRPSRQERELAEWLDRRNQLVEDRAREKSRLDKCPSAVRPSIERSIRAFDREIDKIETRLRKIVASDPKLAGLAEVIVKVDGVGEVMAWTLLAYLPELGRVSRNKIKALVGLAPYNRDSGDKQGRRCIAEGRAKIRRATYMATISGMQHNDVLSAYIAKKTAKGKPAKVAIVAAMAKLIIHLNTLAKEYLSEPKIP